MFLKEAAMSAVDKVLMEVNNNILLIVVNPQGILNQHVGPHLINITITLYYVLLIYKKMKTLLNTSKNISNWCNAKIVYSQML
jgi:hypothetical protein